MNDLIQRLRAHYPFAGLPREAADRIEALERRVVVLETVIAEDLDPYDCKDELNSMIVEEIRAARAALAPEQGK